MFSSKIILAFAALAVVANAQRGSYAGRGPIGKPGLASRFRDDSASSTTDVNLSNRLGEGSTERIPVDARGDYDLVNRISQWPRENQPFWYINAEHIERSRNQRPQVQQVVQTQSRFGGDDVILARPPPPKSSFAG